MPALALQQKPVAQGAPKAATTSRSVVHEEEPHHDARSLARGGTSIAAALPSNSRAPSPFGHSIQHLPSFSPAPLSIQPKLKINQPGDKYEQEADRVADMVMRMPEPTGQRKCSCGGTCDKCKGGHSDGEHELLQMKRVDASSLGQDEAPPIVHEVLKEPGQPLDEETLGFMEPRFGMDLNSVRVHAGESAGASAKAMNALAYTVGSNVVFAPGGFAPGTATGRKLLAHELAHVMQQTGRTSSFQPHRRTSEGGVPGPTPTMGQPGPSVMRQTAGSVQPAATPAPTITHIDVDQSTPQTVTLTWSDGTTSPPQECSTGKGHCCVDGSTAQGGTCSESGSAMGSTNCTPMGTFRVTRKIPETSGGVKLWTQFVDRRSVALHKYSPVDGTPLSHGCVRLHEDTAQTIFDGAISEEQLSQQRGRPGTGQQRATTVKVRNPAQPKCDHPTLQREWMNDLETAGEVPDGDGIDPRTHARWTAAALERERRHIRRERRDLRSAIDVNDERLDEILEEVGTATGGFRNTATPIGNQALLAHIPRCIPTQTTEEARIPEAIGAGVAVRTPEVDALERSLRASSGVRVARRLVQRAGQLLWRRNTARAQSTPSNTDDRQLYWERLQMTEAVRRAGPRWLEGSNPDNARRAREELLTLLEQSSRGMEGITLGGDVRGTKRILISGFDPFRLGTGPNQNIARGNPSGAAALALDGQVITVGTSRGRVHSVVFPVRFADFDQGIVEGLFGPFLQGEEAVDLIMTISMGISNEFELERYAGRRRSAALPDNAGIRRDLGGASGMRAPEIPGVGPGPEFLRTNMVRPSADGRLVRTPALESMQHALGRRDPLPAEYTVREMRSGASTDTPGAASGPAAGSTAVQGSGGGYLSNEIFYRISSLRSITGASTQVIHLHTPIVDPRTYDQHRERIITTVRSLLQAALPNL